MRSNAILIAALLAFAAVPVLAAEKKADEYVTSEKCKMCHRAAYDSWKSSLHSKIVMPKDVGILKDAVTKWATDGVNPGPTTGNISGKTYTMEDVKYVVGSNWKQRYLVVNEATGGYQFLNKQFNRMSGKWENYGQKNDWNAMCATCHTTGYRLVEYNAAEPANQKGVYSELSVGCEACHGPGAKHVKSRSKKDIFTFAGKSKEEQTRVCGYCHIRLENENFKSPQGNAREDFPAPTVGASFKPAEDWRTWYPEHVVIPGVQAEDKIDAEYVGDLKGLFKLDDIAKATGYYEAAKHHQEYQEFIQSNHYKKNIASCNDCHLPHAVKGKTVDTKAICSKCHDATFTIDKFMPATGKTADNLFVRSHTFHKSQQRPSGPTASGVPEFNKK